jgi:phosphopantothenoylcysteine synthetase/decarboxylase
LIEAGANADRALSLAADSKDVEAARICVAHGANLSVVIEEQREKAAIEQARRESIANDAEGDGKQDHDSHSSEDDDDEYDDHDDDDNDEDDDDDDEPDAWTQMEEFFRSVEGMRGRISEE